MVQITEKSSAVLEMVCVENSTAHSSQLPREGYSDVCQCAVASNTIGLHHHAHDTAGKQADYREPSVPALGFPTATGICFQVGPDFDHAPGNFPPPNFGGPWTDSSYSNSEFSVQSPPQPASEAGDYMDIQPSLLSLFGSDVLNGIADILDSPLYFWTITVFEIWRARHDKTGQLLVLQRILSRHVDFIRSLANGQHLSTYPVEIINEFSRLWHDLADRFSQMPADGEWEQPDTSHAGDGLNFQAGSDFFDNFNTFKEAYSTVECIYKYLSDREAIYPLVQVLVAGTLFAFGCHAGDSEMFSCENIKITTRTIFGYFRAGSLGSIVQLFDSISKLVSTWVRGDGADSFYDHVKKTNQANHYYEMGCRLLKLKSDYSTLKVSAQRAFLEEVHEFNEYCVHHLGAGYYVKGPWVQAKSIIPNSVRLSWFKSTWVVLDGFYQTEISKTLRVPPCVFWFHAGSSIGKTTLITLLNQMILHHHLGIPLDKVDTFTYTWPSDNPEYANGLTNGTKTIIFDDLAQYCWGVTKNNGGDSAVKALLSLINMTPFMPDQAALENKGRIAAAPSLVLITSNNTGLDLNLTYKEAPAVERRLGQSICVRVSKEFATEYETLDSKKLNDWMTAHPGEIPDAWRFYIETMEANNQDYIQTGKGIKTVRTRYPEEGYLDTYSFLKWASKKFLDHTELHTKILDTINEPFNFGPILSKDAVPPEHDDSGPADADNEPPGDNDESGAGIAPQAGFDLPLVAGLARQNMSFGSPPVSAAPSIFAGYHFWLAIPILWIALLFIVDIVACLRSMLQFVRQRFQSWYDNLLIVRVMYGVRRGRSIIHNCSQSKRRAIEWLDTNKRTLGILAAVIGVGTITMRALDQRRKKRRDYQVGDEEKSKRAYTVYTNLNDQAGRWSSFSGSTDVGSMYGLTKQSSSADGTFVVSAVATNVVRITLHGEISSYEFYGVFVRGRQLLINRHSLPQFCGQRHNKANWSKYTMTVHGAGHFRRGLGYVDVVIPHDQIVGNHWPGRDLVGIVLPTECRPHRDISDYFIKAPLTLWTESFVHTRTIMPPGTEVAFSKKVSNRVDVYPAGHVISGEIQSVTSQPAGPYKITPGCFDETSKPVLPNICYHVKTNDVITKAGDCGSLYFLHQRAHSVSAIGGLHLGQRQNDPTVKVVIPIYDSDLKALFPDASSDLTAEMVSALGATENQSGILGSDFKTCEYKLDRGDIIRLHNSPILSPTDRWSKPTLEYMKDELGVEVNPDSFSVLGQDKGGGNLSSSIARSPMYDRLLDLDPQGLPDDFKLGKDINNLNRPQRNHDAAVGIAKIMTHKNHDPELAREFMDAAESYLESIVAFDSRTSGSILGSIHPVSVDVAINGSHFLDGDQSINHKGMEAMTMNTSPGFPWTCMSPDINQGAASSVGKHPWFRCTFLSDGRRHYTMGTQLLASYTELLSLFKKDHQTRVKFVTACKDEVKKPSKPTRLIMVGPQCMTIVCREFLLTICRVMQLFPFVFGAVVGLDATCVQWDQVHHFICGTDAFQRHTFDGDYKEFDKSLFQEVTDGVKWVIHSLCERSGHYDPEQLFVVDSILDALLSPVVDVFGIVYWFRSLNTSGNSLTTQINCMANMLFIWVAWTRRMKKDMGANYNKLLCREMFERLVHVVTYGDDHIVGINYPDLLNCRIMQQELSSLITYTDAHKNSGSDIKEFTPHDQLIFLGRSMVCDSTGSYQPPLEFKRIAKTFLFYKKRPGYQYEQLISEQFRGALLEVHFHGKDVFQLFFDRLVGIMSDHYGMDRYTIENTFFLDNSGELLTYEFFRQWWLEKKDKGFLHDPKYEMAVHPDLNKNRELYQQYLSLKEAGTSSA